MRFIKYANGLSQIVTEDHPIITEDGEIPAINLTTEHRVFSTEPYYVHSKYDEEIYNSDFGWLVGICLSEATAQPSSVSLRQKETKQRERIFKILDKYNMPYSLDEDDKIRLKVSPREKIIEEMLFSKTAKDKSLPIYYLDYPDCFMDGVIAGLIDGDGTIGGYKNR